MDTIVTLDLAGPEHTQQPPGDFLVRRLTTPVSPIKVPSTLLQVNFRTFNGAYVFFLDDDIAVKLHTQRYIPDVELPSERMLVDLSVANFVGRGMERELFERLRSDPHPNLVYELDVGHAEIAFFERLAPLTDVWGEAGKPRRYRWARELVSAFEHLEHMGRIPTGVRVEALGVDRTGRLKLVGFGASPRRPPPEDGAELNLVEGETAAVHPIPPSEMYRYDVQRAHQRLACCLHYVLSGVNPDADPSPASWDDRKIIVNREEHTTAPEAAVVADILQRAWNLKTGMDTLAMVAEKTRRALDAVHVEEEEIRPPLAEEHYRSLQPKCREWLAAQEPDTRWMGSVEDYEAACEAAGY